jgi:hypothetical protein
MSPEDDKVADELHAMMKTASAQLGEHCDSVIIIATKTFNGDDFVKLKASSGSIFTNYGAVKEWLIRYEEQLRENVRKENDE